MGTVTEAVLYVTDMDIDEEDADLAARLQRPFDEDAFGISAHNMALLPATATSWGWSFGAVFMGTWKGVSPEGLVAFVQNAADWGADAYGSPDSAVLVINHEGWEPPTRAFHFGRVAVTESIHA